MYLFFVRMSRKLFKLCATIWISALVIWLPVISHGTVNDYSETEAAKYLESANNFMAQWSNRVVHADWNWITNLTDENSEKKVQHYLIMFIKCKNIFHFVH